MELLLILILGLWIGVSWVVSSFFEDRMVGRKSIFWLSLLLSPIIGILIGLSSKRVEHPIYQSIKSSLIGSLTKRKDIILNRIERLKREEELDLISDLGRIELEKLIQEYKSIDLYKGRIKDENIQEMHKELKKRKFVDDVMYSFLILIGIITIVMLIYLLSII